jgi:hypothetical protein
VATVEGPFMEEMGFGNKNAQIVLREFPMIINSYMENYLARRGVKRAASGSAAGSKEEGEHN